jgi:hypothetical protein
MFSNLSFSSISFATETPSLVISRRAERLVEDHVTAFRAEGDFYGVGQDVHALSILMRATSPNFTSFAAMSAYLLSYSWGGLNARPQRAASGITSR